jgi:hypothetical protein
LFVMPFWIPKAISKNTQFSSLSPRQQESTKLPPMCTHPVCCTPRAVHPLRCTPRAVREVHSLCGARPVRCTALCGARPVRCTIRAVPPSVVITCFVWSNSCVAVQCTLCGARPVRSVRCTAFAVHAPCGAILAVHPSVIITYFVLCTPGW